MATPRLNNETDPTGAVSDEIQALRTEVDLLNVSAVSENNFASLSTAAPLPIALDTLWYTVSGATALTGSIPAPIASGQRLFIRSPVAGMAGSMTLTYTSTDGLSSIKFDDSYQFALLVAASPTAWALWIAIGITPA